MALLPLLIAVLQRYGLKVTCSLIPYIAGIGAIGLMGLLLTIIYEVWV